MSPVGPRSESDNNEDLQAFAEQVLNGSNRRFNTRMAKRHSRQTSHPSLKTREQRLIEALRRQAAPPGTNDPHRTRQSHRHGNLSDSRICKRWGIDNL